MNLILKIFINNAVIIIIISAISIYLVVSVIETKGPAIRIETMLPAEDFIVRCTWHSDLFVIHGGMPLVSDKVAVIKSGEIFECGYSFWSGIYKAYSNVSVLHPVYTKMQTTEVDEVLVIKPVHALQVIQNKIYKFNEGYWNGYKNPGYQFASSLGGCGVSFYYLDIYSQVKKVNKEHFRNLYENPMKECLSIVVPIYKKYRPKSAGHHTTGEAWSSEFWNSDKWKKYE